MKLAAIDIGSNAVRLQITKVLDYKDQVTFKKLEYVRFPLRLGHDVFTTGRISEYNKERFYKLMTAYKNLIDLYEVDEFYGCATSAIRESENGRRLIDRVREGLDLDINVISGEEEADIINKVIGLLLDERNYLHVDVGGGSTELNIYENRQKVSSSSFKLGSVRRLEGGDEPAAWEELKGWLSSNVKEKYTKITAIGTGGNINKLFELAPDVTEKYMHLEALEGVQEMLRGMTEEKLLNKLQLNPDRADVIIPASEIYLQVMRSAGARKILVPDVGLKDGINYYMYERVRPNGDKVYVRN